MTSLQIVSTVVFYLMMLAFLALLWQMVRNGISTAKALQVLSTVALKNAEISHTASEAALKAASAALKAAETALVSSQALHELASRTETL